MTGPLIEPTDEMVKLALDVFLADPMRDIAQIDAGMRDALATVFGALARDYTITPKQTPQVATSCGVCHTDIGLWSPPSLDTGYTHIRPGGGPDWDLNRNHEVAPVDLVPFPPDWTAKPAAAPQCPACTSPYPHHRFVLHVMDPISHAYAGDQQCSDPWHDADAVTTAPCLDAAADAEHLAALSDAGFLTPPPAAGPAPFEVEIKGLPIDPEQGETAWCVSCNHPHPAHVFSCEVARDLRQQQSPEQSP